MKMIPAAPYAHTRSSAELKVFDQLRKLYSSTSDGEQWFALHSLNLSSHEYKRCSEIDFLVVGTGGVFVLEVKGGGISQQGGIWYTTKSMGQPTPLRESPFNQAKSAMFALEKSIPNHLREQFITGFGVIFPDINQFRSTIEWDNELCATSKQMRNFRQWFDDLMSYWQNKYHNFQPATKTAVQDLIEYLRPDFEYVTPLSYCAYDIGQQRHHCTQEQYRFLDVIEVNKRVLCEGGAGTGKTMLALELAKRWTAQGKQVALCCFSPWMKYYLIEQKISHLTVSLIDALSVNADRRGIHTFDAVIIDEAQDIINHESLSIIDTLLSGGLKDGQWCFFLDHNHQKGLCGEFNLSAYSELSHYSASIVPLRQNCRNTQPIINYVTNLLSVDMGHPSFGGNGPDVKEFYLSYEEPWLEIICHQVNQLINERDIAIENITILTSELLSAEQYHILNQYGIEKLDEYSAMSCRTCIGIASVDEFKGQESDVVIFISLSNHNNDKLTKTQLYVGTTRARVLLISYFIH